jgi:hypothetical protein
VDSAKDIAEDFEITKCVRNECYLCRMAGQQGDASLVVVGYGEPVRLDAVIVDESYRYGFPGVDAEYGPVFAGGTMADAIIVARLGSDDSEGIGVGGAGDAT